MNEISARVLLTDDAANKTDLSVVAARQMIWRLYYQPRWDSLSDWEQADFRERIQGAFMESFWSDPDDWMQEVPGPHHIDREKEISNRVDADRLSAAIILACHVYKFAHGSWPTSLSELLPHDLPRVPIDPGGDGKQLMGYLLVPHGTPDGLDRPLVYYRSNSRDGLFFRLDGPEFGFYYGDGSNVPRPMQKHGGVFLDVTLWKPPEHYSGPATQPLPQDSP